MKIHCLGSGSSGNSWVIEGDEEALVIDAGVSILEAKKALYFNISKIVGVAITHSHGDHNKFEREYKKVGIPVFNPLGDGGTIRIGGFSIGYYPVYHDVPNYIFYVNHKELGNLLYVTDTNQIPYNFEGLNHLILEANYCPEIINQKVLSGSLNAHLSARIESSHMSIATIEKWLMESDLSKVETVTLCHLSSLNSDSRQFTTRIERVTGKPVQIARKGLIIQI